MTIPIIYLSACSKHLEKNDISSPNTNIKESAEELMIDDTFISLVKTFSIETAHLNDLGINNYKDYNQIDSINKAKIIDINNSLSNGLIYFLLQHENFVNQSKIDKMKILQFIKDSISSESYRNKHIEQSSKLMLLNNTILNSTELASTGNLKTLEIKLRNNSNQVSATVVIGCAIGSLMNFVEGYQSVIKDIAYIITQGFTGMALFNMSVDIIKNASPWWKVASILISFGACILPSIDFN